LRALLHHDVIASAQREAISIVTREIASLRLQ
jgi:hypothetical protein